MIETIPQIAVIWKGRKQTLKECTETFIIFLERLKLQDSRFEVWYGTGESREAALKDKVKIEYNDVKSRLSKNCKDSEYPEFNFDIFLWNGSKTDSESFGMNASLGGDGKIGNSVCVLNFPWQGELFEYYRIKENWENLLELFIDHWHPDEYRDFNNNLIKL